MGYIHPDIPTTTQRALSSSITDGRPLSVEAGDLELPDAVLVPTAEATDDSTEDE